MLAAHLGVLIWGNLLFSPSLSHDEAKPLVCDEILIRYQCEI